MAGEHDFWHDSGYEQVMNVKEIKMVSTHTVLCESTILRFSVNTFNEGMNVFSPISPSNVFGKGHTYCITKKRSSGDGVRTHMNSNKEFSFLEYMC